MRKFYAAGLLALEAAQAVFEERKEALRTRFPAFFLEEFEKLSKEAGVRPSFLDNLCIEKNTKTFYSRKNCWSDGASYAWEIGEGGIFAALWTACEYLEAALREEDKSGSVGCEVALEAIPLDQHILEILEYVRENPYEVSSKGCFLIACEESLSETGMTEIGKVTEGKARILRAGEKVRYLTPPARQEKDMEVRRAAQEKNG